MICFYFDPCEKPSHASQNLSSRGFSKSPSPVFIKIFQFCAVLAFRVTHLLLESSYSSIMVPQRALQRTLIHPFTHQWGAAAIWGAASPFGSNSRFSILPRTPQHPRRTHSKNRKPYSHWTTFDATWATAALPYLQLPTERLDPRRRGGINDNLNKCLFSFGPKLNKHANMSHFTAREMQTLITSFSLLHFAFHLPRAAYPLSQSCSSDKSAQVCNLSSLTLGLNLFIWPPCTHRHGFRPCVAQRYSLVIDKLTLRKYSPSLPQSLQASACDCESPPKETGDHLHQHTLYTHQVGAWKLKTDGKKPQCC